MRLALPPTPTSSHWPNATSTFFRRCWSRRALCCRIRHSAPGLRHFSKRSMFDRVRPLTKSAFGRKSSVGSANTKNTLRIGLMDVSRSFPVMNPDAKFGRMIASSERSGAARMVRGSLWQAPGSNFPAARHIPGSTPQSPQTSSAPSPTPACHTSAPNSIAAPPPGCDPMR